MSTKKAKIMQWVKVLMIVAFGILFLLAVVRASVQQQNLLCTQIIVNIEDFDELKFINEQDVLNILSSNQQNIIVNKKVKTINLKALEKSLEENEYIANAEVYLNFDGALKVDIEQKKPLFRIINKQNVSYYISKKGHRVPISSKFTPRLIVCTGYIPNAIDVQEDKIHQDLQKLVKYINQKPFWNAMIGHIAVAENQEFVLTPKLKGHTVLLGSIKGLDKKMNKLEVFYKKALKNTHWQKYKQINLKYKEQIICSQ